MKLKFSFCKRNIKRIIFVFIFLVIVLLCSSKTYASTIDSSNMSINIDITGKCYVEEKLRNDESFYNNINQKVLKLYKTSGLEYHASKNPFI